MGTSPSPTMRLPAAGPGRDGRSKLWVFSRLSRNATVWAGRSDVATTAFDVALMTSSFGVRWEETATGGLSFDAVPFQGAGDYLLFVDRGGTAIRGGAGHNAVLVEDDRAVALVLVPSASKQFLTAARIGKGKLSNHNQCEIVSPHNTCYLETIMERVGSHDKLFLSSI